MIVLGRIVAPFGVKGWVKVHPFGDDPLSWSGMGQWWLGPDPEGESWTAYTLKECKEHGKGGIVARFAEVPDRNGAEGIEGLYVAAPREAMPPTGEDEYYWSDLIGMAVVNGVGVPLGSVSGLLSTGAHDVLQIQDGETERLIPFVAAYVTEVDSVARRIVVAWEADW